MIGVPRTEAAMSDFEVYVSRRGEGAAPGAAEASQSGLFIEIRFLGGLTDSQKEASGAQPTAGTE